MTAIQKAIARLEKLQADISRDADQRSDNGQNLLAIEAANRSTGVGMALEILKAEKFATDYAYPDIPCVWVRTITDGCVHYDTSCMEGVDVGDGDSVPAVCPHCGEHVMEIRP